MKTQLTKICRTQESSASRELAAVCSWACPALHCSSSSFFDLWAGACLALTKAPAFPARHPHHQGGGQCTLTQAPRHPPKSKLCLWSPHFTFIIPVYLPVLLTSNSNIRYKDNILKENLRVTSCFRMKDWMFPSNVRNNTRCSRL